MPSPTSRRPPDHVRGRLSLPQRAERDGGDRLAAIRGDRSAAPFGHRRADERGAGLALVGSSATTNFVIGSRRRADKNAPIRPYLRPVPKQTSPVLRPLIEVMRARSRLITPCAGNHGVRKVSIEYIINKMYQI